MTARGPVVALLLLLAACGGGEGAGEPPPPLPATDLLLRVTGASGPVPPGQAFPLTVVRVWSKDLVPADLPDRALAPLVVRPEEVVRREDDRRVEETRRYRGYAFSLGDLVVPAAAFTARPTDGGPERVAKSPPLRVRVRPTLDPQDPGPVEAPGDPIPEPGGLPAPQRVALAAAAVVLAVLALVAGYRRRRRAAPPAGPPLPPPPTPAAVALDRLRGLRERIATLLPGDPGSPGADVAEVAEVVRQYVGGRFDLPTGRMTTEEVRRAGGDLGAAGDAAGALLAAVLAAGDGVKFAAHVPTATERERGIEAAEAFVHATGWPPAPGPERPPPDTGRAPP